MKGETLMEPTNLSIFTQCMFYSFFFLDIFLNKILFLQLYSIKLLI